MFEAIKNIFKKEEVFECIVWDGKVIRYLDLNQKEIDSMREKGYTVTLKSDC